MVLTMEKWKGKVAVVTGASSGIGAAIAEHLVKQGLIVVGIARRLEIIEKNAGKLNIHPGKLHAVKCDLTKPDDIIATFKHINETYGPINVLINNAGIVKNTTLIDGNIDAWKQTIDTNILGLSVCTREAVAIMKKHEIDGHIVHINSLLGHRIPAEAIIFNMYAATKHAVTALTEMLRLELKSIGSKIKISSVSPGMVKTDIFNAGDFQVDISATMVALDPEDIADAVVYVLSTPPNVQVHELTVYPVGQI